MYCILLLVSERDNCQSLYRFYCVENEEGNIVPYGTSSFEALQEKINELLITYTKKEMLIVHNIDYDTMVDVDETQCQAGNSTGLNESDIIRIYNATKGSIFNDQ